MVLNSRLPHKVATILPIVIVMLFTMTGCVGRLNDFYKETVSLLMRILIYGGVIILIALSIKSAYEALQERQLSLAEGLMRAFTVLVLIAVGIVAPSIVEFVIGAAGSINVNPPQTGLP